MTHPDQEELEPYLAGLYDGDGHISTKVKENHGSIGHNTSPVARLELYFAGLLDSDGNIGISVGEYDGASVNHESKPKAKFTQTLGNIGQVREELTQYLENNNIEYSESVYDLPETNHKNKWVLAIGSIDGVDIFLRQIREYLRIKKKQADIMVDEILPLFRLGEHLEKRGFLKIMAWRDVMNHDKGGNRGKYNLPYFEDLWDMRIDLEELGIDPDLRETVAD